MYAIPSHVIHLLHEQLLGLVLLQSDLSNIIRLFFLTLNSSNVFPQKLSGTEISSETDHPTEQTGIGHKPGVQLLSWSKDYPEYTRFTKWRLRGSGEESYNVNLGSTYHRENWGCFSFT